MKGSDPLKKEDKELNDELIETTSNNDEETVQIVNKVLAESNVYNHYPGDRSQYPMGTPNQYLYPKIDFQEYQPGQVITSSSSKDESAPYFATSGTLTCQQIDGVKDGFTSTYNFRMLCNPTDPTSQKRVRYTDFETLFIGRLNKWHAGAPSWSGFHIFGRYQTEDDLYVASLRKDGKAVIKKKVNGAYSTLKYVYYGDLDLGEEYFFQFQIEGNVLTYKVNGEVVLQTTDDDLDWGTTGVRFDYSDAVVDYLRVSAI